LLQAVVDGIGRAAELSLLAVGLTMVYGALRFANFAHVEFATIGAYLALALSEATFGGRVMPLALAAALAIPLTGAVGVGVDALVFRRLRSASPIMLMIASFALAIVIRETIRAIFGPSGEFYSLGVPAPVRIGSIRVTPTQLVVIGASLAAILAFHLLLSRTRLGIAIRATADNAALAQASGLNSERVIRIVWFIGSAFAALGGVLIGLNTQLKPDMGVGLSVEVFSAAILGGIGNPDGAMLGAAIIGFTENVGLAINWGPPLHAVGLSSSGFAFIPSGYKAAIPFTFLIATLLLRPQGILGAKR
jgi:branched-subunit amino acid ABC-type transport system permease component